MKKYWIKSLDTDRTYLISAETMDGAIKIANKLEGKTTFGNVASQLFDNFDFGDGYFDKINYIEVKKSK